MKLQKKIVTLNSSIYYTFQIPSYSEVLDFDINFDSALITIHYLCQNDFDNTNKIINICLLQHQNSSVDLPSLYDYKFYKIIKNEKINFIQLPSSNYPQNQGINISFDFKIHKILINEYFLFVKEILHIEEDRDKKLTELTSS